MGKMLLLPCVTVLFLLYSCDSGDRIQPNKGSLAFSLTTIASLGTGTNQLQPAFALFSVSDGQRLILKDVKVPIARVNDRYIGQFNELALGSYQLTKFVVLDESGKAIYGVPLQGLVPDMEGSELLPLPFTMTDRQLELEPDLLAIAPTDEPEVFGLASSSIDLSKSLITLLVLDGIATRDTVKFNYRDGKINAVNWCQTNTASTACDQNYTEMRYYNQWDHLYSIEGKWRIFYYVNESGLRTKIVSYFDGYYYSTANLQYNGSVPSEIRIHYAANDINEVTNVGLTFDAAGDLVLKTETDGTGNVKRITEIEYSYTQNPLRSLLETKSGSLERAGFEELAFYYSMHIPSKISLVSGNNVTKLSYVTSLDIHGRISTIEAHDDKGVVNHSLGIEYER